MYYLQVKELSHKYGPRTILDSVSFSIQKWQKIALVARNGMWKSTLLDLLMNHIECVSGEITRNKSIRIWFLSQKFEVDLNMIVHDRLYQHTMADEDYEEREHATKIKKIINKLKLNKHLDQTIWSLSWGEQKRLSLAKVLMDEPDMLILDEPTNHLDLDMIEWLEKFLRKSDMTLLMVTHDRYFLQRVCNQIIELERGHLHEYSGNYNYYLTKKAERLEQDHKDTHIMKQLYRRELARVKKAPRARETKSRKREQEFNTIQDTYLDKKASLALSSKKIEIARADSDEWPRLWNKIITLSHVWKSFDTQWWQKKEILSDFSHEFRQGERIGIMWKNGVWKSTFFNILTGEIDIDKGKIDRVDNLRIGYYSQQQIFPEHIKVLDYAKSVADWMMIWKEKISATKLLERFLFTPAQQQSRVHDLSGGEQRRLYLLITLMRAPNFLILDEPTNDLDIETLTALEDFLGAYTGCLIVISHDRYFIDKIADRIFFFEGDGKVSDFQWWYTMFTARHEKRKLEQNKKNWKLTHPKVLMHDVPEDGEWILPARAWLTRDEKKELESLMRQIAKGEERKHAINLLFQNPDILLEDIKKLWKELSLLSDELDAKEMRWMELSEKA